MSLERLWAGWRGEYVGSATAEGPDDGEHAGADDCVFCRILASDEPDEDTYVLWRGRASVAILNAFPYTNGHLMIMPTRHVGELESLEATEGAELWGALTAAVVAVKAAYHPEGVNLGANLGRAAGAGMPGHLHLHCLPRWSGDTNFMTTVAETRVLPEALATTWSRLRTTWPLS
ncbi:MAG: HIT domain-containing protein [Actinobacteria bacterium]|nr:HIT domain-containing protein [Actinomycetota bacterium]